MTAKKRITLLSNASKAVIAAFKAEGHEIRFIDAPARPSPKTIRGPVVEPPRVQAFPKVATIAKAAPLSSRTAGGPVRPTGSVAGVDLNPAPAPATIPKKSSRWPFWNIITKAEIARRREARQLNPPTPAPPRDHQTVAAEKAAKRARLFLPNGKRAEQHWRPWLEAAAKAEKMSLAEAAENFGGIEALSAPKGYRQRMALCEFANAMSAQTAA